LGKSVSSVGPALCRKILLAQKHQHPNLCIHIGVGSINYFKSKVGLLYKCEVFSKAKVKGVVYGAVDTCFPKMSAQFCSNYLVYEDSGQERYAEVLKFCLHDYKREFLLARKVVLEEPAFRSEKLKVQVNHIRPFKVFPGEEVVVRVSVDKIKKPILQCTLKNIWV